jgi:arylsulfatase A-like enzyme
MSPTCSGAHPAADAAEGLLVVTIDRLPAWMLSAYGATWVATPELDRLAARGIVFDRVITPVVDPCETLDAVWGIQAGTTAAGAATAAGLLAAARERHWKLTIVTDDADIAARTAAAGADADVRLVAVAGAADVAVKDADTAIGQLMAAAVAALCAGGRRLVCVHITSLGLTWDAPSTYRDQYFDPEDPPPPPGAGVPSFAVAADTDPDRVMAARQVFAGQLSLLDRHLGALCGAARGCGLAIVGVRGLPLGLHGWVGPGGHDLPYGELVHVPAILVDATGRMAGQRYGGLVIPADIGATLVDLVAGAGCGAAAAGHDPRMEQGAAAGGRSLAGLFTDWSAVGREEVVVRGGAGDAVVTSTWHCLREPVAADGPRLRLFAKPDDFFELTDVADRCGPVAADLGRRLD